MKIDKIEICRRIGVEHTAFQAWIEAGWIHRSEGTEAFSEADEARARLIQDLTGAMGVNDEGIAVILDLVDQIHGLRFLLREACRRQQAPDEAANPEL